MIKMLNSTKYVNDPEFDRLVLGWVKQEVPHALHVFHASLDPYDFISHIEQAVFCCLYEGMSMGLIDEILACRIKAAPKAGTVAVSWIIKVADPSKSIVCSRGDYEINK